MSKSGPKGSSKYSGRPKEYPGKLFDINDAGSARIDKANPDQVIETWSDWPPLEIIVRSKRRLFPRRRQ
jgi:hypothetical protein